jgi:hypothetical protein
MRCWRPEDPADPAVSRHAPEGHARTDAGHSCGSARCLPAGTAASEAGFPSGSARPSMASMPVVCRLSAEHLPAARGVPRRRAMRLGRRPARRPAMSSIRRLRSPVRAGAACFT